MSGISAVEQDRLSYTAELLKRLKPKSEFVAN
jgi:hypothetical protein